MDENEFIATGRRKEAIARIQLILSDKPDIIINHKELNKYFTRDDLKAIVKQPLLLTKTMDKLKIIANVTGGGIKGQAEAIRHGISRALVIFNQA
ncbi:MAG: 30S ribosomal protein S9, partial [Candidatus Omnitrophica bacterium]|nr:30S ribosomal protein S9 [Candidatus Omnitrophota bacterium]